MHTREKKHQISTKLQLSRYQEPMPPDALCRSHTGLQEATNPCLLMLRVIGDGSKSQQDPFWHWHKCQKLVHTVAFGRLSWGM